ncbi:hypothetical protein [Fodinicola acaciae]|nr:hypothetical protein [Fodinicola acaciae]
MTLERKRDGVSSLDTGTGPSAAALEAARHQGRRVAMVAESFANLPSNV